MLGKKTMEAELLREAVELAREKNGFRSYPYQTRMGSKAFAGNSQRRSARRFLTPTN
jgi:hypothetical protein